MKWFINNWRLLAFVTLITLAVALSYQAGAERVQSRWNTEKLIQTQEIARQKDRVITIERQATEAILQKQKELENEKERTKIAVAGADTELNRLRNTINTLKLKLPNPTGNTSSSEKALTKSWEALGSCASEYTEMGKVADEQRDELAQWQAYGQTVDEFREDVMKVGNR